MHPKTFPRNQGTESERSIYTARVDYIVRINRSHEIFNEPGLGGLEYTRAMNADSVIA